MMNKRDMSKDINKGELAEIMNQNGFGSVQDANDAITAVCDAIEIALNQHDSVTLRGFGTFKKKHREERNGRNPRTGEKIIIKAQHSVGFKQSDTWKKKLN